MAESVFCVVVHDVTPVFAAEIDQILAAFEPLVGGSLGGAVVPCWHGRQADAADVRQFQRWDEQFGELLLHGWTHFRENSPGIISCATGRADEFGGATPAEAARRLTLAQAQVQSIVGRPLRGFVPPAWQFPVSEEPRQRMKQAAQAAHPRQGFRSEQNLPVTREAVSRR